MTTSTSTGTGSSPKSHHRIAMICDFFYPRVGGVEMHIWSLSQHLIQLGHKVIVITHSYDNRKGVRYMNGPLKPIIPMTDQDALPTVTATFPLIRQILIRESIEIVHVHQATSVMANECVVYATAMGLPSVYTDHSLFQFDDIAGVVLNRVLQTTMSTLNAAICVSNACRYNFILRTRMQNPSSKISIIPNAVDASKFLPLDPKTRTYDRIKIVVVSRLVYRKGTDLLIGIIPKICHALSNVDFIVGGNGNKLQPLQEMVEREQLTHRVEFLGAVSHANVPNVLRRGHVFLNCSLTESFCIAILEAVSCGLLAVSTNVGGVPEVLPSNMNVLCNPDVDSLVEGLKIAIQRQGNPYTVMDPHKAHEWVKNTYSWRRVAVQTIEEVYDKIIQEPVKTFQERLICYHRLGGFSGMVACLIAFYIESWIQFVIWLQPRHTIDVVPDLMTMTTTTTIPTENESSQTKEKVS